jgi:hypothetical protein
LDPLASASQVLGLLLCTTQTQIAFNKVFKIHLLVNIGNSIVASLINSSKCAEMSVGSTWNVLKWD